MSFKNLIRILKRKTFKKKTFLWAGFFNPFFYLQGWHKCTCRLAVAKYLMWWTWKDMNRMSLSSSHSSSHKHSEVWKAGHSLQINIPTEKQLASTPQSVCLCVSVCNMLTCSSCTTAVFTSVSMTCVLSHVSFTVFSLKPTDQWDPRVSSHCAQPKD